MLGRAVSGSRIGGRATNPPYAKATGGKPGRRNVAHHEHPAPHVTQRSGTTALPPRPLYHHRLPQLPSNNRDLPRMHHLVAGDREERGSHALGVSPHKFGGGLMKLRVAQ